MRTDTYSAMSNDGYKLHNDTSLGDTMTEGVKHKADAGAEKLSEKLSEKATELATSAKDASCAISGAASCLAAGVSEAVDATTEKIDEGWKSIKGMYQGSTISKVTHEISALVQKYPIQSILGGIALGAWFGMKSSLHQESSK